MKLALILNLAFVLTCTNFAVELTKFEKKGYQKATHYTQSFYPKITIEDAVEWKKRGLTGFDIYYFFKSCSRTFHPNAKLYTKEPGTDEIFLLMPYYLASGRLEYLKQYHEVHRKNVDKFLAKHLDYIGVKVSYIPKSLLNTEVKLIKRSSKTYKGYVFIEVVKDNGILKKGDKFWTVEEAIR